MSQVAVMRVSLGFGIHDKLEALVVTQGCK